METCFVKFHKACLQILYQVFHPPLRASYALTPCTLFSHLLLSNHDTDASIKNKIRK